MASSLDKMIIDPLENMFDAMGAMQGEAAPVKRAAIGAAVGYAVAYGIKPGFAWNKDGTMKVFAGTADQKDKPNSTWFPVWAIIAIPAVIFSTMI